MRCQKPSKILIAIAFAVCLSPAAGFCWTAPIGIPAPPWPGGGVDQPRPVLPAPWISEQAGWYYVSASGCSDSRTYGYPGGARCSVPAAPVAGSKIVLDGTISGDEAISFSGTSGAPTWVMAYNTNSKATITGVWELAGNYVILDSLTFNSGSNCDGNLAITGANVMVRGSTFSNTCTENYGAGVAIGGTNVVFYSNIVSQQGNWQLSTDVDRHGIKVYDGSDIWIVDSALYHCQGDGVQVGDQNNAPNAINRVYVGRNTVFENLQSCLWTKNAADVIFSQNTCYNITFSNGGVGQGMGGQYDPSYVWFLFNEIYNTKAGIHIASSSSGGGGPWYAVGNLIYNVQSDTCNEYDYGALGYRNEGGFYAFHNTVYDVDSFLTLPPSGGVVVKDNIFASKKSGSCPAINAGGEAPTMDYNLYSSDGWGVEYNSSTYDSISGFSSATGQEAHRRTGNPLFNGAPSDLSPQFSSPAVGNAYQAVEAAYTSFSTRYGRSIQYDFNGAARPIDTWDIGAYEYGPNATERPAAPQNLRIVP
jgi:hypothetical protein